MINRRIVTFSDADRDVLDYLDAKPKGQRSSYVRDLIRKDMNGDGLDERIRKIVSEQMAQQPNDLQIKDMVDGFFEEGDK